MPELEITPAPPRPELLQQLRARLGDIDPGLRFLAQDLLGADAPIDLVAVDASGRAVLLLLGDPGEDLELVGRAVAQRAWVEARLGDWLQLAPNLGVRPESGARVVLLCPSFRPETLAAARALGPDGPLLVSYRCVRNGGRAHALLEPLAAAPRAAEPGRSEPVAPAFRSGLSDAELGLTPEERGEFSSD